MDMISNNFMQKNKKIKDKNSNRLCKDTMSVLYSKTEVQLTRNKQQNTLKSKCKEMKKIVFVVFFFVFCCWLTAELQFDTNAAMGKVCSSCREELGSANNKQPTFQKALGATRKVSVGAGGLLRGRPSQRGNFK